MKHFLYPINSAQVALFFPPYLIKNKFHILEILLEATRFIKSNKAVSNTNQPKMILKIEKMSRLFFFNNNKYYSIIFPFSFIMDNDEPQISYKNLIDINSKTITDLLSILKDSRLNSNFCLDFVEPICDLEPDYQDNLWLLIKDLITIEDGYLRFDNDPDGFKNAKEKGQEHRHPENHLDIFYTSNNTFKIGLKHKISPEEFIDYVNTETDCKYLKNFH
jgi:hypothetical protein